MVDLGKIKNRDNIGAPRKKKGLIKRR